MTRDTLWDRTDEPMLRWVATLPSSLEMEMHTFETRDPQPFEPIPGMSSQDAHASLKRLASHNLIDGDEDGSFQSRSWGKLRVTAAGWIVLGEWPDLDRVASAAAIHRLLRALAEEAPKEVQSALVRAAGVVSRTADEVVRATAADIAGSIGREAIGE